MDVLLDKSRAADGEVELLGGIDVDMTLNEHVSKTVNKYESEMEKEQRRVMETNDRILATENSFGKLKEDIDVSVHLIVHCLYHHFHFSPKCSLNPRFYSPSKTRPLCAMKAAIKCR